MECRRGLSRVVQLKQRAVTRRTLSFGKTYEFQTGRCGPGEPSPCWHDAISSRAARLDGIDPDTLEQALVIQYGSGAGIGWHKDRPVFEHVIGVSLGAPATMRFSRRLDHKFERATDRKRVG